MFWDSSIRSLKKILLTFLAVFTFTLASAGWSDDLTLGSVDFPTSAKGDAQREFEIGVLALHSFWYEEARDHFKKAQRLDPGFALTYWGEAMTFDHPLWGVWGDQDTEAGKEVFARLDKKIAKGQVNWSEREKAWVAALQLLYVGEGNLKERREAYSAAMNKLAEKYPAGDEAIIFAALARLSLPDLDSDKAEDVVSVAAPLEEIYQRRPEHPGVLHYLIHVYDSPKFAAMGLRQARTYARVAPAASHALHMPSHIFREFGMWRDVVNSNVDSYQASVDWQMRTKRPLSKRDFHALDWLHHAYLQLGQYQKARGILTTYADLESRARKGGEQLGKMDQWRLAAEARQVEAEIFAGLDSKPTYTADHIKVAELKTPWAAVPVGYLAAIAGDPKRLDEVQNRLREFMQEPEMENYKSWIEAKIYSLAAVHLKRSGSTGVALARAKQAMLLENTDKSSNGRVGDGARLYAELLMESGNFKEAQKVYARLHREWPQRAVYEIGLAKALAAMDRNREAAEHYQHFADIWSAADSKLPLMVEVEHRLKSNLALHQ